MTSLSYSATQSVSILDKQTQLSDFEYKSFQGHTHYHLSNGVLNAISDNACSGLYFAKKIDLNITPYLNWSWKVTKPLNISNEQIKDGDDFAARIYVIANTGWLSWQKKVLAYVWTSNTERNEMWNSPYLPNNVKMIAMNDNTAILDHWYHNTIANMIEIYS